MKLNEHERARPNIAGLTSPVQQAEMKLLLAGRWPPLKPLPVFKYETAEYRASIDFDKTRGEWVCRKTSLPSNKVQELRGGLTEITMALPHGQAEVFAECAAAEQQEQELEKDASRRLQAILEWRENYENGALYSGLQDYLSESQQDEIDDSIRLTLTARQLQFNPKNVAFVFDALSKAGGRLATLIEIAQRNKTEQGADVPARAEAAALDDPVVGSGAEISIGDSPHSLKASFSSERAKNFAREPIKTFIPELTEGLTPAPVESLIPATFENFPTMPIGSVFPEQDQPSSPELIARSASQASKIVTPEILDANPQSFVEDLQETVHHCAPVAGFGQQVRTGKVESSADRVENSPSRLYVLEISGFQVAAVVILFAVISLTIGLTVGRGALGKRLRGTQKSLSAVDATSQALLNRPGETTLRTSSPPAANTFLTPAVNPPAPATAGSRSESPSAQSLNARPEDSATRVGPIGPSSAKATRSLTDSDNPEAGPERKSSTGLIARNAPPPANSQPAHSPRAVGPISGAPENPAPRRVTPATRAAPHLSSPSTILVTGPGDGSKPFRLILPEKPIAASSSFAMTSQLSILVSPEPGPAPAHKPARLQAGELVSYVWPRYPRPGDRHGSSETVKVRTTIGQLGQVLDVKHVSGSISLFPAAMSAIRLWRYKPTLLNERPVQAQQDVTIEFRPPQYLLHVPTRHPSHN
jgi:TonB family protein